MGWKAEGARSIMATGRLIWRLRSMSLRMLLAMAASEPLHPHHAVLSPVGLCRVWGLGFGVWDLGSRCCAAAQQLVPRMPSCYASAQQQYKAHVKCGLHPSHRSAAGPLMTQPSWKQCTGHQVVPRQGGWIRP